MPKAVIVKAKEYHSLRKEEVDYHIGGESVCSDGERIRAKYLATGRGKMIRRCDRCSDLHNLQRDPAAR